MKILFVENHARFTQVVIGNFLSNHLVTVVPSIAGAKEALASEAFDLVLLDYDLDDGKGTELVPYILAQVYRPLVIAASSHAAGNAALEDAGADGVCRKADFAGIETIMSHVIYRQQTA
jgi:DNA-binding response OmpR family regulator